MEKNRFQGRGKGKKTQADLEATLRKAWYHLRLTVRHPARAPTWDAIVLTAASPEQAQLYDWQLSRAKRFGRIAPSTITLSVPDPQGHRIGSGGATLNAIFALAQHLGLLDSKGYDGNSSSFVSSARNVEGYNGFISLSMVELFTKKHILLVHAGGDSKRVPWANPMGKAFLPLPYLASEDQDSPVPLLFDHIIAIASGARQAFKQEGGLFTMTGDVLPCFDASILVLPEDAACVISVPIALDIAANHGVIVTSRNAVLAENSSTQMVKILLQKPSMEELLENQAILDDGRTLLDTGIIAVQGKAWTDLVSLAYSSQSMISKLLQSKKEVSLYEDLVAAWVPAKHEWLQQRPLGNELVSGLGKQKLFSYCADDLLFLHFGTSNEVLDHLSETGSRIVARRHLSSIPATTVSDIAASAIILSSEVTSGASIGEDALVYDSSISGGMQIGSLCVVVGLHVIRHSNTVIDSSFKFILPDRHCLWEVPLVGYSETVVVYCGVHDNPKSSLLDGTFCGKPWKKFLDDFAIEDTDLWTSERTSEKCLWNARIFPILPYFEMLVMADWLMGVRNPKNGTLLSQWKRSQRTSLEELHRKIDFRLMCSVSSHHQADLAAGVVTACLNFGLLGRNISQLCDEVLQKQEVGADICRQFLLRYTSNQCQDFQILPKSRALQVHLDLLRACSEEKMASLVEKRVWAAVADETASAVRYGFRENLMGSSSLSSERGNLDRNVSVHPGQSFCSRMVRVELPVRVDFLGGWSDTPPWSLERAGCVLNMAITLEGSVPIGTIIETTKETGLFLSDDTGEQLHIEEYSCIAPPFDSSDPFRLVKAALLVTSVINKKILQTMGLRVRTWANVPRGSGLGTSSILAAAVVKGLLQITDEDDSIENVARLVLVLEQLMGTGGGWQDQIGGLYPGLKFTLSYPGIPLRLQVIPLIPSPQTMMELQQRLLVVFTGQVRLAHHVLQKVVTRYLRRDSLLISSIKRLAELAKAGREALMNCDIDELGVLMLEAWTLHQELDPYCSNESVDKLFAFCAPYCCGYKLVGAGGGGFGLLLAKTAESAKELKSSLTRSSMLDVKIYDWEIFL